MPKSPKEMYEAIVRNLESKTGKSLDQWKELIKKKGPKDRKEKIQWLEFWEEMATVDLSSVSSS